jgi:hypothetical protein
VINPGTGRSVVVSMKDDWKVIFPPCDDRQKRCQRVIDSYTIPASARIAGRRREFLKEDS